MLFDHAENGLLHIGYELADRGHRAGIHAVVGDVTDGARVEQVLTQYQPEIVFHAAAHKHVPLMEANACEAVLECSDSSGNAAGALAVVSVPKSQAQR